MRRAGSHGVPALWLLSHQEGFGELIMSGKNMRLSSLALSQLHHPLQLQLD